MARVFGDPTARADLDSCAYRAFGISTEDPEAMRHLMRLFGEVGYRAQAEHFAHRLQRLSPGDSEADGVLRMSPGSGG